MADDDDDDDDESGTLRMLSGAKVLLFNWRARDSRDSSFTGFDVKPTNKVKKQKSIA